VQTGPTGSTSITTGPTGPVQTGPTGGGTDVTGVIKMCALAAAPDGWLLCNGAAVSRTTYGDLFAAIASTYGAGDASTTFNVPDMRGRIPVGVGTGAGGGAAGTGLPSGGSALTAVARGSWWGAETHTLSVAELATHSHTINNTESAAAGGVKRVLSGDPDVSTNTAGSGSAHNNLAPSMGVNFIIKT